MNIIDRKSPTMPTSLSVTGTARNALGILLEREERRAGSREVAYANLARRIGRSASWVKKFLTGHLEVKDVSITVFLNIRAAYEDLCNRVEAENKLEEARITALRGRLEITEGFFEKAAASLRDAAD